MLVTHRLFRLILRSALLARVSKDGRESIPSLHPSRRLLRKLLRMRTAKVTYARCGSHVAIHLLILILRSAPLRASRRMGCESIPSLHPSRRLLRKLLRMRTAKVTYARCGSHVAIHLLILILRSAPLRASRRMGCESIPSLHPSRRLLRKLLRMRTAKVTYARC